LRGRVGDAWQADEPKCTREANVQKGKKKTTSAGEKRTERIVAKRKKESELALKIQLSKTKRSGHANGEEQIHTSRL